MERRHLIPKTHRHERKGGIKARTSEQRGVFPAEQENREQYRRRIGNKYQAELAQRAGLPDPETVPYRDLGNPELPVWKRKAAIQHAIRDNRIVMLEGATGSGKSTQLCQYALEQGFEKIIYLEPRIVIVDNLASRVQQELSEQLGPEGNNLVGVAHSERSTRTKDTKIDIMTPGTFLKILPQLEEYHDKPILIVGDEIHEGDMHTELGVAAAAEKMQDHPNWRLCLASATLDTTPVHEAFTHINGKPIPSLSVEGRPFEMEMIEESELTAAQAYAKYGIDHRKAMAFTSGKQEILDIIEDTRQEIRTNREAPNLVKFRQLHAKLPRPTLNKVFTEEPNDKEHMLIASTSAGQSGLTVSGLTLVISDGETKRPNLDHEGTPGLFKELCAQDELIQQAGRAGRDVGGGKFILVRPSDGTSDFIPLSDRIEHAPAEIYHTNISRNVLMAAALNVDFSNLNRFMLHPVTMRTVIDANEVLYRLKAIDDKGSITEIGLEMDRFPLRPELSRSVVEAMRQGCSPEVLAYMLAVTSSIEAGGLPYFAKDAGMKWKSDVRETTKDDYIAQLDMFMETRKLYDGVGVNEVALLGRDFDPKNNYRAHRQFDKMCRIVGLAPSNNEIVNLDMVAPNPDQEAEIRRYLTSGLFDFAQQKVGYDPQAKAAIYKSIFGAEDSTPRLLSKRSVYEGDEHELLIGMPRRFEKKVAGEWQEFHVVENVLSTSRQKLFEHAMHLCVSKPEDVILRGGHLTERYRQELGNITIGGLNETTPQTPSLEGQKKLIEASWAKKGAALEELCHTKDELYELVRLVPESEYKDYFPKDVLTQEVLESWLKEAAKNSFSVHELDNHLRKRMFETEISIDTWIKAEKRLELYERSPSKINFGPDVSYSVVYHRGRPVIYNFNLEHTESLPDTCQLDDGREILFRYTFDGDEKRDFVVSDLKQMVAYHAS